ncbi:L-alanine-DL-glutamate epimerase-like enolase superfamily enzyme [Streptacidiphilus sp. BW17]|uniref:enolase C-terminal domain-like protein n=1 Tax=Streptacidiphilus sp. BW17 TaxID=3156274 RepID=UPI00351762B2
MAETAAPALPDALTVSTARVPMRRSFAHAAHVRDHAESVLVRCRLDGVTGWGEGAPRPYVTGETTESAQQVLTGENAALPLTLLRELRDSGAVFEQGPRALALLDLPRLLGGLRRAPAAAAALETALLDAWCRLYQRPLRDIVRAVLPVVAETSGGTSAGTSGRASGGTSGLLAEEPQQRPVTLVVDLAGGADRRVAALGPTAAAALRHVKLKASPSAADTARQARTLRGQLADIGAAGVTVSVDANAAWTGDESLRAAELLGGLADWLEEPTAPRDWAQLRRIREQTGMAVMLDESAVDVGDVATAAALGAADAVNLRVSKCGGLIGALKVAAAARRCGLRLQVGVQVAEVGPLWVVGRILGAELADLLAVEAGRQDEWFDPPLTEPPYRVDRARHLAAVPQGPGLGVVPSPALLRFSPGFD